MAKWKTREASRVVLFVIVLSLGLISSVWAQVKPEIEPNDSRREAQEIRLGDTIEGGYQKDFDQDWYKLGVDKPGRLEIQVDLSAIPGFDQKFMIQDQKGTTLWSAVQRPMGEPESVSHFTVTEGVYYLWLSSTQKAIPDKYTLSIRVLGPWNESEEAEPNDNRDWATEVGLGKPMTGRVSRDNDNDFYFLKVPEPGLELLVIQVSGIPGANSHIDLFDDKDKVLDQSASAEPGMPEELTRMKVQPGTYFLRVVPPPKNKIGSEYVLYAGKPQKPPASPAEVQQALIKALDWLASKQEKDGSWKGYPEAYTGLSLMAFLGSKCAQKDYSANIGPAVQYLKSVWRPSSKYAEGSREADTQAGLLGSGNMYQQAIAALSVIEALVDLNDAELEPVAREAVGLIVRSQNTENKPESLRGPVTPEFPAYGGWRYNPNSTDSDLSVSAWQILTLRAAVNAGFSVPDEAFTAAAKYVRSLQCKDGSFGYQGGGTMGGSCARAGMGALSLQLCGFPQDPAIRPALLFMQTHAPRWNAESPGEGYPFYYWYYATRAMFVSAGDDWRLWKDWICRFLVEHQNQDGSWNGARKEKDLDCYRAALGALMLEFCCGHVPVYLSPVKRTGAGTVRVDFDKAAEKEAGKTVEIIMDASNSMTGTVGQETKIAAARRVLTQTINGLPATMSVGFRVYGHRFATDDYDNACRDTELLVPIGPVNKAALLEMVGKIQTKGRTPLVLSLLEAVKDFEKIPRGSIILVTDGIESCKGDIKSIAPAIKAAGLELEVNIVGFDIKEAGGRQELESIARSTGGRYLDAKNADELLSALETTLKLEYVMLDARGQEAGRGIVGGEGIKLKEGPYTLRVLLATGPLEVKVTLMAGALKTFTLRKDQGRWLLR
jgi:hypothetical protein